jgi:hypothetical protein
MMDSASRPSGVSRMKSASRVCIGGYTFRMKWIMLLLTLAAIGVLGYAVWIWRERLQQRERASQERFAAFMKEVKPPPVVEPRTPLAAPREAPATLAPQKLLFEAAAKAGEAGEPVLAIQLYARLLSRFPETALGAQARAAIEAQKAKLAKA